MAFLVLPTMKMALLLLPKKKMALLLLPKKMMAPLASDASPNIKMNGQIKFNVLSVFTFHKSFIFLKKNNYEELRFKLEL